MAGTPNDGSLDTLDYSPLRTLTNLGSIAWQHKSLVLLGVTISLVLGGFAYVQPSQSGSAPGEPIELAPEPSWGRVAYRRSDAAI